MQAELVSKEVKRMAQDKGIDISPDLVVEAVKRVMAALTEGPGKSETVVRNSGKLDAKKDFPIAVKRPELVKSAGGLALEDIGLEKVTTGKITFEDIKIRPDTLEYQAQIAESAGRPRLARNLRRAAELTRIPDERVLEVYNALRPYRSTKQELLDIAAELESKYQAEACGKLVREAADVYERRGRLKQQ